MLTLVEDLKKEVTKELIHNKKMKQTKDGRNLVPKMELLKEYVGTSLAMFDLEEEEESFKLKPSTKVNVEQKKEVKIQAPEDSTVDNCLFLVVCKVGKEVLLDSNEVVLLSDYYWTSFE